MNHAKRARGRVLLTGTVVCSLAILAAFLTPAIGSAATRPHTGVTAHRIILGTTTPLSGPAAPGYDEIAPATAAVFSYVNAHGGIYGRKITYDILDDGYDPQDTVSQTEKLVEQDGIFADVGPLGTPTQLAVQGYLNSHKVPQLFVESGCACWSSQKYPYTSGWQPNYIDEGKILGQYVWAHYSSKKIGYLYQDDEFGGDGVKGLDQEIKKSSVVSRQTYQATSQGLANGLGSQVSKLKAAHARVVVLYTIPAATALALLAAAELHYHPRWIVSSVGADPPTVGALLKSFSKGKAGPALMNGMISNAYLPPESDASNSWIKFSKAIVKKYDTSKNKNWDGNTEYGAALGYSVVELLKANGKHLTRASLLRALESADKYLAASNLVPFTYGKHSHYGMQGSEIVRIENGKVNPISKVYVTTLRGPITVYSGKEKPIPSWLRKG